ncbi:CHAT domain-containing protein [Trichocoleus sp. FACHB-591]|uniref:CHAT domain-containing protein n=1 Tax=Trichocoleus sp. FACHB-591 TaxID=2692872 RepID=UPI001685426B|nr:CHAT domain-containing protein [Trichocoleus sp. FACHB-591]MBD2095818.1 CHAT domain-containing protein [Trichocoleus sp. FACHB-591]
MEYRRRKRLIFSSKRWRSRHLLPILLCALLRLGFVLGVPALSVQPPIAPVTEIIAQSPNAHASLKQGIDRYEAGQFTAALESWQQALGRFKSQSDRLNEALVLSNLSLAYQQLGRWQEAEEAVAQSLAILRQEKQSDALYLEVLAKALNTQGRLQWSRGELQDAVETWQHATVAYKQAGDHTGTVIGLINQANALKSLGFNIQAETQLETVRLMVQQQPSLELKTTGLRSLGTALRRVGKLEEARSALQESLQVIDGTNLTATKSSTLLELGNTERALANKAIAIGKTDEAQQHTQTAITFYQQATEATTLPITELQAHLNQFSLQVEMGQQPTALIPVITAELANLPLSRTTIDAELNYAKSLLHLNHAGAEKQVAPLLATAIQQARSLNDPIAESYGLGQLGELYEQTGQWSEAQNLTQQALLKAESAQAAEVRYRWEWQLGRLLAKQRDSQGAIASYREAVESLETIRNDLLLIDPNIQFSFRDDVEPVYREFVELLLTAKQGEQPSQDRLRQAIHQVDALQLAELENFLGCNLAETVAISDIEIDPTAAKIYPMLLENRLAVVLEFPDPKQPLVYHEVLQPRSATRSWLQTLRQDLSEPDRTPEAIAELQVVYQWLIAPFESVLKQNNQIQTLVFVPDAELRNIPMAALYDGNQYLITRYAIAVAPRLELFRPKPRPRNLDVLLGGIGEPQTLRNRTFPKIENLTPELEGIRKLVKAQQPLLNEAFTEENLERRLKAGRFSVIHFKTHGIFSSDPEETFIVAYRELITGGDIGRLIQLSRARELKPIELLILSACSTAQGDNRAVLGLAGIAVQAGTRSVVSTLWEAQDLPTTQLMVQLYQALLNPKTTRAQALRQAQLHLIEQGYSTPYVWASYILVGNWL